VDHHPQIDRSRNAILLVHPLHFGRLEEPCELGLRLTDMRKFEPHYRDFRVKTDFSVYISFGPDLIIAATRGDET
jgi:hypothetical protein